MTKKNLLDKWVELEDNMLLFEFYEGDNQPSAADVIALINQLNTDVENGEVNADDYTVDELLDYFQKYDVILDVDDLFNMIKMPPLKDLITNIQGDKVVFKGVESNTIDQPEENDKKVVAQMAKKAMKKN